MNNEKVVINREKKGRKKSPSKDTLPRNCTINWITKFIKRFTFSGPHPGKGPRLWVSRGKESCLPPAPTSLPAHGAAGCHQELVTPNHHQSWQAAGPAEERRSWDGIGGDGGRFPGWRGICLTFKLFLVTTPFSLLPFPFSVVVGLDYRQFRVGTLLRVAVPSLETPHLVGVCRLYINIITAIRIKLERDPIFTSSPSHS